jgi:hypothetical protein
MGQRLQSIGRCTVGSQTVRTCAYHRGSCLHELSVGLDCRLDQALQTVQKGLEVEANNASLWTLLRQVQEAISSDKKERYAKDAREREMEEAKQKRLEEEMAAIKKKADEVRAWRTLCVCSH